MLTSKRTSHRIYETTYKGKTYAIDGQNHEFDSKEWQLFLTGADAQFEYEWIDTYPTKKDALEAIPTLPSNNYGRDS